MRAEDFTKCSMYKVGCRVVAANLFSPFTIHLCRERIPNFHQAACHL